MAPRDIRLALVAAQAAALVTLLRSVAYERWITVVASLVLVGAAAHAQRGRTWAIALTFACACWFPVTFAIGIAPPWFCFVGIVMALPFLRASRLFSRFDRSATAMLAAIAATLGALAAIGWKNVAWSVFESMPALRPSLQAEHGLIVAALAAASAFFVGKQLRALPPREEPARVRVGAPASVRVADAASEVAAAEELDDELVAAHEGGAAARRIGR